MSKEAKVVSPDVVLWEMNDCKSKQFHVTFLKRETGEVREMQCRRGVKKGVKGVGANYEPAQKGLIRVYDMVKEGYRMIPVEGIMAASIDGTKYIVTTMQQVYADYLEAKNASKNVDTGVSNAT